MNIKTILICTLILTFPSFAAPVPTTAKVVSKTVSVVKKTGKYMKTLFKTAPKKNLGKIGSKSITKKVVKDAGKIATNNVDDVARLGTKIASHGDDVMNVGSKLAPRSNELAKTTINGTKVLVSVSGKSTMEIIEIAARKSNKILTPTMKKTLEQAFVVSCKQYGDDVVRKVVANGGLEALEKGLQYGDEFWRLGAQVPEAVRQLVLHTDDLLPIAKRIGPEFLKLESLMPGLGKKAVSCFGDDAVKFLAKLPEKEAAMIINYGIKADSPKTAKLLLETCEKSGNAILNHLNGPRILAYGLSTSMIIVAIRLTEPSEPSEPFDKNPSTKKTGTIKTIINYASTLATLPFIIFSAGIVMILGYLVLPIGKWLRMKLDIPRHHPIIDVSCSSIKNSK